MTSSHATLGRLLVERIDAYADKPIMFREVKELLKVTRATAAGYVKRADFPAPVDLSSPRTWRRYEVEAWAAQMLPLANGSSRKKRVSA